ncbi:FAD-dependent oxidoreductase [Mycolicibacterium boenickei]|nr:FAD-dependent oxidoreductase [Mycolicibacterium boenickei]
MAVDRIVVVGASAAGLAVAESARSAGYEGALTLIGAEPHLPYDRPPLSKQFLTGEWEADALALRPSDELNRLAIDFRLGVAVEGLDMDASTVGLADGGQVSYDALVIATGTRARRLPGTDGIAGVHVLRELEDARALRTALLAGGRMVVIGAGVLGMEAAAVARRLGLHVTVVDPLPLPMMRVVGTSIGEFLAELHREHGVDLRCGVGVEEVETDAGRVHAVRLTDGAVLPADIVLVAIGATPSVEWLAGSAVPIGDLSQEDGAGGVLCGSNGRSVDNIWAAGDVAAWRLPDDTGYRRVEHRLNASEQGRAVARSILDPQYMPPASVPYFWSDQYDVKIQSYGIPSPAAEFVVVDGDLPDRRFVGAYVRNGLVTAALGVGMARSLRAWRARIGEPMQVQVA